MNDLTQSRWLPIVLLTGSNIFMTFAWYGTLNPKFKTTPLWLVILGSWGIASLNIFFMIPANRWGNSVYSVTQLKIIQEVITLSVFCVFAMFFLGEKIRWNDVAAFVCIMAAVAFAFWPKPQCTGKCAWQSGSVLFNWPGLMRKIPAIAALALLSVVFPFMTLAQEESPWDIRTLHDIIPGSPEGRMDYDPASGVVHYTQGICINHGNTVLTADSASLNQQTGEAVADGHVRIEMGDQLWVGEHITYNFKTHQMRSEQFRTGKPPVFAAGRELDGDVTNGTYNARHAMVTTDDVSDPIFRIRASHIKIVPGKYIEMWNAVLFAGDVPAFYFPYYRRNIGPHANNWNFVGGFRTSYGPYIMDTYTWWLNDAVDGKFHVDYREKRGPGVGPDLNLHMGQWGNAVVQYYYTHDHDQYFGTNGLPNFGPISENRQRVYFGWQATPYTNLNLKALVNYQSDAFVEHDFFESQYRENPQPNTFIEANKYSDNWSLDALTTPELNNFFDQVERLPDVKLTGLRQQVLNTPIYYDSESSVGYYKMYFTQTNGVTPFPNYSASRADTYHKLLVPWTFFNWLNITPRVGGRFTSYSAESGPVAPTPKPTARFSTPASVRRSRHRNSGRARRIHFCRLTACAMSSSRP